MEDEGRWGRDEGRGGGGGAGGEGKVVLKRVVTSVVMTFGVWGE